MGKQQIQACGLENVGITDCTELIRNPSFEDLFRYEMDSSLEGFERGVLTNNGAVAVDTGLFTGRSPKDKYLVVEEVSRDSIWWAGQNASCSDNKPMSEEAWRALHRTVIHQLNGKRLFIVDGFCGANPETRISVRVVCEVPWQAHFCKNMFIRPTEEELAYFTPDWTTLNASKTTFDRFRDFGLRSEVCAAFNIKERMQLIVGTWYGGEIKKGVFTIVNYFLPLQGIGSFHCSANMGPEGDTALFFGLSGTGKTTLSADPKRALIGDDEHGWDDEGVFNFEGGCYAKTIDLSEDTEPEIYRAIRRDALLENVAVLESGQVDYADTTRTQNTRVSYPIHHIENIVSPVSRGGHPRNIIFLACDAFGVLPPLARLDEDQAMYQYLSGYTAKVAGTELGIAEPVATFSACYGAAFLPLHPTVYADVLGEKMKEHGTRAYLMNTGWTGGPHGVGHRMSLPDTRRLVDAIFEGALDAAEYDEMPVFGLRIPKAVPGVDSRVLSPRNTWEDKDKYDETARKLAEMFVANFKTFTATGKGKQLEAAGPTP